MNTIPSNYFEIKNYVKKNICNSSGYSAGEEDLLIEEALNLPKEKLVTKTFVQGDFKKINRVVNLRQTGKPLNKIFKRCFFYKDTFYINRNVLAPRQETEILVDYALKTINSLTEKTINVLDLCCGSGAIGLTIAKHSKKTCCVWLSDVSLKTINVAKRNAKTLQTKNTKIIRSNLFNALKPENKFDIIVSNPPYIKTKDISALDDSVKKYDPVLALDGGVDGLYFYREICKNCKNYLNKNGVILLEIGYNQKKDVEKLFATNGFTTQCVKDFSNNDRVIIATVKEENKNDW